MLTSDIESKGWTVEASQYGGPTSLNILCKCMHACMHNRFRTRAEGNTSESAYGVQNEATDDDNDMCIICIWSTHGADGCIHYSVLPTHFSFVFFFYFPAMMSSLAGPAEE